MDREISDVYMWEIKELSMLKNFDLIFKSFELLKDFYVLPLGYLIWISERLLLE